MSPLARPLGQLVRRLVVRDDDDAATLVARAEALWRHLAPREHAAAISPAFEVAWLLLEDASLAPALAEDDEERTLVHHQELFMALAADRDAWLAYLERAPAAAPAELRARRAARARLLYGAVHPHDGALADARLGTFVTAHVDGPIVCMSCRRRKRPATRRLAAAGDDAVVDVVLSARELADARTLHLRVVDDAGFLRARLEAADGRPAPAGRWRVVLEADHALVEATLEPSAHGWHGHNLGPRPAGPIHRVELEHLAP